MISLYILHVLSIPWAMWTEYNINVWYKLYTNSKGINSKSHDCFKLFHNQSVLPRMIIWPPLLNHVFQENITGTSLKLKSLSSKIYISHYCTLPHLKSWKSSPLSSIYNHCTIKQLLISSLFQPYFL